MSGPFQRLTRRGESPDPPTAPTPVDAGDVPTQQLDAVVPEPPSEAQTAVHEAVSADAPPPVPVPPASAVPAQPLVHEPQVIAVPGRQPGFRERGRMRRRVRYLRKLRELQARDLGGLVFDLRRFERTRDDLVAQKIDQIRACDDELRALERALAERRDVRELREPGIGGTCPRCFAIHSSNDRFCAHCGAALGGAPQGPAQVPMSPPPPVTASQTEPPATAPPQ